MSEQAEPVQSGQTSTARMGRPPKLNEDELKELYDELAQYINDNDDPIISDFLSSNDYAISHKINDSNLYDWTDFSVLIKRLVRKQETFLLRNGGKGVYNPTLAIFRLKQPQHGYRDRYETDLTTNGESINLTPEQAEQALRLRAERAAN